MPYYSDLIDRNVREVIRESVSGAPSIDVLLNASAPGSIAELLIELKRLYGSGEATDDVLMKRLMVTNILIEISKLPENDRNREIEPFKRFIKNEKEFGLNLNSDNYEGIKNIEPFKEIIKTAESPEVVRARFADIIKKSAKKSEESARSREKARDNAQRAKASAAAATPVAVPPAASEPPKAPISIAPPPKRPASEPLSRYEYAGERVSDSEPKPFGEDIPSAVVTPAESISIGAAATTPSPPTAEAAASISSVAPVAEPTNLSTAPAAEPHLGAMEPDDAFAEWLAKDMEVTPERSLSQLKIAGLDFESWKKEWQKDSDPAALQVSENDLVERYKQIEKDLKRYESELQQANARLGSIKLLEQRLETSNKAIKSLRGRGYGGEEEQIADIENQMVIYREELASLREIRVGVDPKDVVALRKEFDAQAKNYNNLKAVIAGRDLLSRVVELHENRVIDDKEYQKLQSALINLEEYKSKGKLDSYNKGAIAITAAIQKHESIYAASKSISATQIPNQPKRMGVSVSATPLNENESFDSLKRGVESRARIRKQNKQKAAAASAVPHDAPVKREGYYTSQIRYLEALSSKLLDSIGFGNFDRVENPKNSKLLSKIAERIVYVEENRGFGFDKKAHASFVAELSQEVNKRIKDFKKEKERELSRENQKATIFPAAASASASVTAAPTVAALPKAVETPAAAASVAVSPYVPPSAVAESAASAAPPPAAEAVVAASAEAPPPPPAAAEALVAPSAEAASSVVAKTVVGPEAEAAPPAAAISMTRNLEKGLSEPLLNLKRKEGELLFSSGELEDIPRNNREKILELIMDVEKIQSLARDDLTKSERDDLITTINNTIAKRKELEDTIKSTDEALYQEIRSDLFSVYFSIGDLKVELLEKNLEEQEKAYEASRVAIPLAAASPAEAVPSEPLPAAENIDPFDESSQPPPPQPIFELSEPVAASVNQSVEDPFGEPTVQSVAADAQPNPSVAAAAASSIPEAIKPAVVVPKIPAPPKVVKNASAAPQASAKPAAAAPAPESEFFASTLPTAAAGAKQAPPQPVAVQPAQQKIEDPFNINPVANLTEKLEEIDDPFAASPASSVASQPIQPPPAPKAAAATGAAPQPIQPPPAIGPKIPGTMEIAALSTSVIGVAQNWKQVMQSANQTDRLAKIMETQYGITNELNDLFNNPAGTVYNELAQFFDEVYQKEKDRVLPLNSSIDPAGDLISSKLSSVVNNVITSEMARIKQAQTAAVKPVASSAASSAISGVAPAASIPAAKMASPPPSQSPAASGGVQTPIKVIRPAPPPPPLSSTLASPSSAGSSNGPTSLSFSAGASAAPLPPRPVGSSSNPMAVGGSPVGAAATNLTAANMTAATNAASPSTNAAATAAASASPLSPRPPAAPPPDEESEVDDVVTLTSALRDRLSSASSLHERGARSASGLPAPSRDDDDIELETAASKEIDWDKRAKEIEAVVCLGKVEGGRKWDMEDDTEADRDVEVDNDTIIEIEGRKEFFVSLSNKYTALIQDVASRDPELQAKEYNKFQSLKDKLQTQVEELRKKSDDPIASSEASKKVSARILAMEKFIEFRKTVEQNFSAAKKDLNDYKNFRKENHFIDAQPENARLEKREKEMQGVEEEIRKVEEALMGTRWRDADWDKPDKLKDFDKLLETVKSNLDSNILHKNNFNKKDRKESEPLMIKNRFEYQKNVGARPEFLISSTLAMQLISKKKISARGFMAEGSCSSLDEFNSKVIDAINRTNKALYKYGAIQSEGSTTFWGTSDLHQRRLEREQVYKEVTYKHSAEKGTLEINLPNGEGSIHHRFDQNLRKTIISARPATDKNILVMLDSAQSFDPLILRVPTIKGPDGKPMNLKTEELMNHITEADANNLLRIAMAAKLRGSEPAIELQPKYRAILEKRFPDKLNDFDKIQNFSLSAEDVKKHTKDQEFTLQDMVDFVTKGKKLGIAGEGPEGAAYVDTTAHPEPPRNDNNTPSFG